jgi:hypothetical protein
MRTGRTTRRAGKVAAAVCVALLASSCSGNNDPGVAADVDGHQITDDQVDGFAQVLCELGGLPGETESGTPTRNARSRALELLVNNEIAYEIGKGLPIDQAKVDAAVQQNAAARDAVPTAMQGTFDAFVDDFARAQMSVLAAGRKSLEDAGQSVNKITDDKAYAEGQRLRLAFADKADITIDPRFGTLVDGVVQPGSGSLSVPQSQEAKSDASATPPATDVAKMPAPLKCGAGASG